MSGWIKVGPRDQNRIGLWGQNDVVEFAFPTPEEMNVWTPSSNLGRWYIFDVPDLGDTIDGEEWVHVATAGDETGIRLWIEGELVAENTTPFDGSSGQNFGASDFFFNSGGGGVFDDVGNQFTGTLDDIAMWDVALTNEQIKSHFEAALGGAAEPVLLAGDADQNLQFDQLDLVQVQIAAKYLTGQPATWGEGDWNGAPGGSPGSPPAGDGLFNQLDIIAASGAGKYLTGPYGAVKMGGQPNDGQTSIVYDPSTGELAVDTPAGQELTSINVDSTAGIFTGDAAQNLEGSFDNDADTNIFKATFGSSFGSFSFGMVAQSGLSEDFVAGDLTVVGSLDGGGELGEVDLIYVPESSSLVLALVGLLVSLFVSRR
jgi:hypothetical protein